MRSSRRKGFKYYFRKIFHRRNIIVMSDSSVDHYPISGGRQLLILSLVIGAFSWVSYSTGSYMAAKYVLEEKDRQLVSTTMQKQKIGEEYTLLKHDLKRLKESNGELGDYAQFVFEQHDKDEVFDINDSTVMDADRLGEIKSRLMDRIAFLEKSLQESKQENQDIVAAVRDRTQDKIKELREVINRTGLNFSSLMKKAKQTVEKDHLDNGNGQGGPFIPSTVRDLAPNLMGNIDETLALQYIVNRLPLAKPLSSARTTSRFGHRYDPFNHRRAMHSGQDFVGKKGARVASTADGVVIFSGRRSGYGNIVEISHGFGLTTRYAHLRKLAVRKGQKVKKGQYIGNQGSTGRSTGEHLHYEVRHNKIALNPMKFIKAGANVR